MMMTYRNLKPPKPGGCEDRETQKIVSTLTILNLNIKLHQQHLLCTSRMWPLFFSANMGQSQDLVNCKLDYSTVNTCCLKLTQPGGFYRDV